LEVTLQASKCQALLLQLRLEILGNGSFFVLGRSNVECFDHQPSSTVGVKLVTHLLPESAPLLCGQNLTLPGAVEKRSRFATQPSNDVTVVNAACSATFGRVCHSKARQFYHLRLAEIAYQSVVIKVEGQLLSNQA
jgi:hypothetical protein